MSCYSNLRTSTGMMGHYHNDLFRNNFKCHSSLLFDVYLIVGNYYTAMYLASKKYSQLLKFREMSDKYSEGERAVVQQFLPLVPSIKYQPFSSVWRERTLRRAYYYQFARILQYSIWRKRYRLSAGDKVECLSVTL